MIVIFAVMTTVLMSILWFIHKPTDTRTPSQEHGFFPFYASAYKPISDREEDDVISSAIHDRTEENVALFYETDLDVTSPFRRVIPDANPFFLGPYTHIVANNPLLHATSLILKLYYNRRRPYQVVSHDTHSLAHAYRPLSHKTTWTPSYPSSHALQSFALAKHLTKLYPDSADEIDRVAESVANARVVGGVHYPTDRDFARRLANKLPWI